MYHKSDLMLKQDQKEIKNMKHIKLNDFSDIRNTIGEYILDPTEKYVSVKTRVPSTGSAF